MIDPTIVGCRPRISGSDEDIPYGIATWSKLGTQYGVGTPLMQAFVGIGSIIMGFDGWENGRSLEDLGIAGIDKHALKAYLYSGELR